MKRSIILALIACVALVAVGAASAAKKPDPGVTVCVTGLEGFGNADLHSLENQGVDETTIPGTFNLPTGLATKVVDTENGTLGACEDEDNSEVEDDGGDDDIVLTPGTFNQVNRILACADRPVLRGDGTMGIAVDLDMDTFLSAIFQGVTFKVAPVVEGIGATCDWPYFTG
jgi:hypothetical protein